MKAGTLTKLADDDSRLGSRRFAVAIKTEVAFPKLNGTGWEGITEKGKQFPLRPLMLTHANDASKRVFVGIQQARFTFFPTIKLADKTNIFLNIEKKVFYMDSENEQGMLGLAFHPKYKTNGEFFVFYTFEDR